MPIGVCLISGGMDSCVSAAWALERGLEPAFLHVNYRHLTEKRELRSFHDIADHYAIKRRLVVDITHLQQIGHSALTDPSIPVPEGPPGRPGIPVSYVPFRNGNLLAIAASWAEVLSAGQIVIGAVEEDSSGYPDCRGSFFQAFNEAIEQGTKPETRIEIVAPLLHLRKKEIVELGVRLGAPFELTWSCYQLEDRACGRCESCRLRLKGFTEAGVKDPILYLE